MWHFIICLLLVSALDVSMEKEENYTVDINEIMDRFRIVPNVISTYPKSIAQVQFAMNKLLISNVLKPYSVRLPPKVTWEDADPKSFYTVCMLDPDHPSSIHPAYRSFNHWLVGNIPGQDIVGGEILAEYLCAMPSEFTSYHRYVFIVHKQPSKLTFDEPRLTLKNLQSRRNFSITNFAKKYNMGNPIAFNFYLAQYDKHVHAMELKLNKTKEYM